MFVKPFDHCIRPSDEFSRRIARKYSNYGATWINFIQPIDPAGGSWYLEPLTEEFTQKAWAKFQEIEAHGGLIKALENNTVQIAINEVLQSSFLKNLATRKRSCCW